MNNIIRDNSLSGRNYTFDAMKLCLAVLVVFRHVPSEYKMTLLPLTTCGVPLFFMVSGWLMFYQDVTVSRLLKGALRIGKLLLFSAVFYFFVYFLFHGHLYVPTFKDLAIFLLFNDVPYAGHLWYLSAYIYVLLVVACLYRIGKQQVLYWIVPLLVILYLAADLYYIYTGMRHTLTLAFVFRSWLFTGIPFFCFGAFLHLRSGGGIIMKHWVALLLSIVFTLCAIAEFVVFKMDNHISDVFFITWPLCFAIFAFFSTIHVSSSNIFAIWGKKYSLYIYIFHPLVLRIVKNNVPGNFIGQYLQPLIVLLVTFVLSMAYVAIKDLVITRKK